MYPGTTPRAPRSMAVRTPIAQGLQAAPPVIRPDAPQTRYRPRPAPRVAGESVYAARFRAAPSRLGAIIQNELDAAAEVAPYQQAEAATIRALVTAALASGENARALAIDFREAGRPIDEQTAANLLKVAHEQEIAASVVAANTVQRNNNALTVLDAQGRVLTVDVSDDPVVLQAQQDQRDSAYRPPTGVSPLVAPQVAPSPADNAAAAVFGQDVPSPHAALATQVQAAGRAVSPLMLVAGAVGLYLLFGKGR